MILKAALVLLYLVIGLWLFVSAVTELGGKRTAFDTNLAFVISMITVVIFWPYFVIVGIIRRKNE